MHFVPSLLLTISLLILFNESVMSWEYAVTTRNRISFFDENWKENTSAAHNFEKPSALALDEVEDTVYFNDLEHQDGTIFSLKLKDDNNHQTETILKKTRDESILGMAFDPLDRILYWTDAENHIIYKWSVDDKNAEPSVLLKVDGSKVPHGIAIDVCRRQLYWTNSHEDSPSIERIALNGSAVSEAIIVDDLHVPSGIVVDQYSKQLYWVDNRHGIQYSVESSDLDGTHRRDIMQGAYHEPLNVAVDEWSVFWTDDQNKAVYRLPKNGDRNIAPVNVKSFNMDTPHSVIVRDHFSTKQKENPDCQHVVNEIEKARVAAEVVAKSAPAVVQSRVEKFFCLNGGKANPTNDGCKCLAEFDGNRCEIKKCQNFCIEGTCSISSTGVPMCTECHPGFTGKRCEINVCTGYCLNDGHCELEHNQPICKCDRPFYGDRCQALELPEICNRFCNQEEVYAKGFNLTSLCNNCNHSEPIPTTISPPMSATPRMGACQEPVINSTAVFVSVGVVVSLLLVAIIVVTIRCRYKPLRPRIKKTYVVHKNVTPTPLTCRPTTEQCEITIENCCNMNICDTPCFDPKTLQAEASKKEDKKMLLNSVDGDLMY